MRNLPKTITCTKDHEMRNLFGNPQGKVFIKEGDLLYAGTDTYVMGHKDRGIDGTKVVSASEINWEYFETE